MKGAKHGWICGLCFLFFWCFWQGARRFPTLMCQRGGSIRPKPRMFCQQAMWRPARYLPLLRQLSTSLLSQSTMAPVTSVCGMGSPTVKSARSATLCATRPMRRFQATSSRYHRSCWACSTALTLPIRLGSQPIHKTSLGFHCKGHAVQAVEAWLQGQVKHDFTIAQHFQSLRSHPVGEGVVATIRRLTL